LAHSSLPLTQPVLAVTSGALPSTLLSSTGLTFRKGAGAGASGVAGAVTSARSAAVGLHPASGLVAGLAVVLGGILLGAYQTL
jgi:hypothetical protein